MRANFPVRLGAAEEVLIAQLQAPGPRRPAGRIPGAGLPPRRVESYHYTDLKTLLRAVPPLAQAANEATGAALRVPGAYALSIVNGAVLNAATAPDGVKVGKTHGGVLTNRDD